MIPASRPRLIVLYLVVAALLLGLATRVWYLQVKGGTVYTAQASSERLREVIQPAVRGQITDDLGAPIVDSRSALVVSVSMPTLWKQPHGGAAILRRLAKLLHIGRHQIFRDVRLCTVGVSQPCWPGSPYQPIPVAEHVSATVGLQVLENRRLFPGVTASVQPVTHYSQPISTDLAQTLGYLQPITASELQKEGLPVTGFSSVDLVGQAGLELTYDKALRGVPGDRHRQRGQAAAMRLPRHQHQPRGAAGHPAGTYRRDPAQPARRQPHQQGRGSRSDDDHGPRPRAGQLSDL